MNNEIDVYWRGEKPLNLAVRFIWILGTGFVIILGVILTILLDFIFDGFLNKYLEFSVSFLVSIYHVLASIVLWRCAKNSVKIFWMYAVRVYLLINALFILKFYYLVAIAIGNEIENIYRLTLY